MKTCPNCGSQITCSCQKRVASDGAQTCGNCIINYEQQLAEKRILNNVEVTLTLDEKFNS